MKASLEKKTLFPNLLDQICIRWGTTCAHGYFLCLKKELIHKQKIIPS